MAYVAATRARDLLVVAAVGEERARRGLAEPAVRGAVSAEGARSGRRRPAPGCPKFGTRTVLNRPPDQPEEVSVRPGLHRRSAGAHEVVWFDPAALQLEASKNEGVENEQVLQGTPEQAVEGLRRYREWKARRAARIEEGSAPRFRVATAERATRGWKGSRWRRSRWRRRRVDRRAGGSAGWCTTCCSGRTGAEEVGELARVWGRRHGATEAEVAGAASAASAALARIGAMVPEGARRVREMELMVRLEDGTLVDGRIDFAWSDGVRWTVVDYKTDRRERRRVGQLQLYALALERATGLPARGIVLEV